MQTIRTTTIKHTLIGIFTSAMLVTGSQAVAQERTPSGLVSVDIYLGNSHYPTREQNRQPPPSHRDDHAYKPHYDYGKPAYRHEQDDYHHHHYAKPAKDYRPAPRRHLSPLILLSQDLWLAPWQEMQVRVILGDRWDGQMSRRDARRIHKMLTPKQRHQWQHLGYYSRTAWHH